MGKDVIIACDFASKEDTLNFLDKFTGRKPFVKIGMELFYAEGPQIVKDLKARGPGDFFGERQHGLPRLKIADMLQDIDILKMAQECAQEILTNDRRLEGNNHKALYAGIKAMFDNLEY